MSYPKTKSSNSPDKEQTLKTENTQTSTRKKCGVKKNYKQNIDLRIIKMHIFQHFLVTKNKTISLEKFLSAVDFKTLYSLQLDDAAEFCCFLVYPTCLHATAK